MRRLESEIVAILIVVCMLCTMLDIVSVKGWGNGGYSSDPNNPEYGTHDWIAQHALDWLPSQEKQYILDYLAAYLYGSELPDNSGSGIGDVVNHHLYYWSNGSLQDDASAVRASEEYGEALGFLQSGDYANASETAGIMSHYIADVAVFGHVMGGETDWGSETHHSDYEDYVQLRTSTYTAEFNTYLSFDGNLRVISAYNATKELAYDTTFDTNGDLTCLWMDQNYDWNDPIFKNRAGESLNLAVNYLTDVLHTLYSEANAPPRRVENIDTGLNYTTIQDAIDAQETSDGHTIRAASGTYYEHVVANKTLALVGETNTTIDGYNTGTVIKITANNVNISGFAVQNSGIDSCDILVQGSDWINISCNLVKNSTYGIRLVNSNNTLLYDNTATGNNCGIFVDGCENNAITGNMISNNTLGICLNSSNNNLIYHNNFISNNAVANATESFNAWNDDYPSGGNYWSEYTDVDYFSGPYRNEIDGDGIWDHGYKINANNIDNYPLMSPQQYPVYNTNTHEGYTKIQDAIDAPQTSDGHVIIAREGIYNERLTVAKSLTLIGIIGKTFVNGDGIGTVVNVTASNVVVRGFTVRESGPTDPSMLLFYTNNTDILENDIDDSRYGIWLNHSYDCEIGGNRISDSTEGIHLASSSRITISRNILSANSYGIVLIESNDNIIRRNNITHNSVGVESLLSNNYTVYHNSFINNTEQVHLYGSTGVWDNGYPSGGNYWSNYTGLDVCSGPYQNETGSDGIGDTRYDIGTTGYQDRYPLMNPRILQHDLTIANSYPSKTAVAQGFLMSVVFSVQNEGDYSESANITLTFPTFVHVVVIASECCLNFNITFNTTGVAMGSYTMDACVSIVFGEIEVYDNNFTCVISITIPGDFSGDFKVGPYDFALLAVAYGSAAGKPRWNPNCDVNSDGKVGPADFALLSAHFGQHYP